MNQSIVPENATGDRPRDLPKLSQFVPFDSAAKMSEATALSPSGAKVRAVKGAFAAVIGLTTPQSPEVFKTANELEAQGFRVLAVATGPPGSRRGLMRIVFAPRGLQDSARRFHAGNIQ